MLFRSTGQMTVRGDEYLLKTAMSNLADNACKYSPDHKVDISINHTGKYLEIKFSNKGNGIPEEELTRVFEPFFRGTNAMSVQGTGIGLSLVRQIIDNHSGSVRISSKPGKGTIITVSLPSVV